jgi:uncharacterized protein involved in outer membrane biogenesis
MRILRTAAVLLVVVLGGAYLLVRALLASDVVRATIERQLAAYFGQPVRIASAGASIFPAVAVRLNDVSIGPEPAPVHIDAIRVVTGWAGLVRRRVVDAQVTVDDGRVALPLPFSLRRQPASSEPGAAAPFTIESVRTLSFRNLSFLGDGARLVLNLDASLEGDRLEVSSLDAAAEGTRIHASGALSSLSGLEGTFDARADQLDADELLGLLGGVAADVSPPDRVARGAAGASGAGRDGLHLVVKLTARAGRFAEYPFENLETTADVRPERTTLSPLSVSAFGGSFQGNVELETGRAASVRLSGRIDGFDVRDALETTGSAGGITGQLGGNLSLTAPGGDAASLVQRATGTITAAITRGTIPHLDLVRAIVLAFGKPSGAPPEGSGSAFTRLGGTFSVAAGTISSDDLTMRSRDLDLAGRGSLRLATGELTARVDVILSEELTAQAGVDLRRYAQENNRVVIPATIGGTLREPTVMLDLAAATERALRNELKRRARGFLEQLLEKK